MGRDGLDEFGQGIAEPDKFVVMRGHQQDGLHGTATRKASGAQCAQDRADPLGVPGIEVGKEILGEYFRIYIKDVKK